MMKAEEIRGFIDSLNNDGELIVSTDGYMEWRINEHVNIRILWDTDEYKPICIWEYDPTYEWVTEVYYGNENLAF